MQNHVLEFLGQRGGDLDFATGGVVLEGAGVGVAAVDGGAKRSVSSVPMANGSVERTKIPIAEMFVIDA